MKKILVVDDEESIRFLYKEEFEEEGYIVEVAKDGKDAIEKYRIFKPDIITLDIKMPVMDGIEAMKQLQEMDRKLPVILCSAYGDYQADLTTWTAGAYVVKCADLTELKYVVELLLENDPFKIEIYNLRKRVSALAARNKALENELGELKNRTGHKKLIQYKSILSAAAHTLRNEFLHIGRSVRNLKESVENPQDFQEECDMIERSINYSQLLLRRVQDHLDIGKPFLEPLDIVKVIRNVESLIRPRLASSIQLKVRIDPIIEKRHLSVFGNIEQLMEVLLELVQNATNVLHEKGGTIEIKLKVVGEKLAILMKDNGPGIPKEIRKDLFKKQVSSKKGLGLGLFLCKKVITTLGGKLNVTSSPQKGTVFKILLPAISDTKENRNGNKNPSN
jgi:two-component system response regulator (stage 0 sporulation protein F)